MYWLMLLIQYDCLNMFIFIYYVGKTWQRTQKTRPSCGVLPWGLTWSQLVQQHVMLESRHHPLPRHVFSLLCWHFGNALHSNFPVFILQLSGENAIIRFTIAACRYGWSRTTDAPSVNRNGYYKRPETKNHNPWQGADIIWIGTGLNFKRSKKHWQYFELGLFFISWFTGPPMLKFPISEEKNKMELFFWWFFFPLILCMKVQLLLH
jgi:hypothetical protein